MAPEWKVSAGLSDYAETLAAMDARAAAIRAGTARELIWLVEHPPLYTAGTSAKADELLDPASLPVFQTGRGGRYTYHGPGQRVVYLMLDLGARGRDLRRFVAGLEAWIIGALAAQGVEGWLIQGKIGVWVQTADGPAKIAALGVRVRQWVTTHGIAINVSPELRDFAGILPCGLTDPVASLASLGVPADMGAVDSALQKGVPWLLEAIGGENTGQ